RQTHRVVAVLNDLRATQAVSKLVDRANMRPPWPEHKYPRYLIVGALWALLFVSSSRALGDPAPQAQPSPSPSPRPAPSTASSTRATPDLASPSPPSTSATPPTGAPPAPALATHDISSSPPPRRREFYEAGWFWGAFGAAAFVGAVVFFAAQDSSPSAIHLH